MKTVTLIDHIFTNSFVDTDFKSAVFKTDLSDQFPVCLLYHYRQYLNQKMKLPLSIKGLLALIQLECLNKNYIKLIGKKFKGIKTLMEACKSFLEKIRSVYNHFFPVISKRS